MQVTLLIFVSIVGQAATLATANPYGGPSAPPQVGKTPPPQSIVCNDPRSRCNGQNIMCPQQCPSLRPAYPKEKACYVDCSSPTCEATCKNRTVNCYGVGSACGDPRFVGGDGIVFYFHGRTNQFFSLVSDQNLQINARFIGRRPEGRNRDNTWIQSLGLMFGRHTFTLAAMKAAKWDAAVDLLQITYDGEAVPIGDGHLAIWAAADSGLVVERTAHCNSVAVTIPRTVEISVSVVPITEEDDRIHNYQIPDDDCFSHLEVQFLFFDLSERVEGVLGQTYRPEFVSPVKRGVEMPIMGGESKYRTSSLLSADCSYCIFSPELPKGMAGGAMRLEPTGVMECTSSMSNGRGVVCRR
ncbi:hypothetical protein SAY87_010237 [Trapa incisa]|uniref:Root cap n=1 Tax=Trapa incisa TaxID=236973 RepID=A0AAN7GJ73_9MYRT|nr:hypothetical protein SAY87_010237 [Trapa incisa]